MTARRAWTDGQRRRAGRERAGRRGEWLAALWLRLKGYRLIARRARTPVGEIDLIMRRGNRLAFIEVKTRARSEDALSAITPRQHQRLRRAAEAWLARHTVDGVGDFGFDLVAIAPRRRPRHIKDIFPV